MQKLEGWLPLKLKDRGLWLLKVRVSELVRAFMGSMLGKEILAKFVTGF
jgi:hypothetical protein